MKTINIFLLAIIIIINFSSCTTTFRRYHFVDKNTKLQEVANIYQVTPEQLSKSNRISLDEVIKQGTTIFVPKSKNKVQIITNSDNSYINNPIIKNNNVIHNSKSKNKIRYPKSSYAKLEWPITLPIITSNFGWRVSNMHEGIDLKAKPGTSIYSAADGVVLYAGNKISGYGNIVVLKHEDNLITLYGHNSELLVKKGDAVKKGQKVALSGNSGRSTGAHLHFEVRLGSTPVDPIKYLPKLGPELADYNPI